jgi:hypothetical protein
MRQRGEIYEAKYSDAIRMGHSRTGRRVGLTVTDANYGAEALILFTKGKFDLVVTVRQVAAVSASVLE